MRSELSTYLAINVKLLFYFLIVSFKATSLTINTLMRRIGFIYVMAMIHSFPRNL